MGLPSELVQEVAMQIDSHKHFLSFQPYEAVKKRLLHHCELTPT